MTRQVLPYGSWPSPITAASLVEHAVSLGQVEVEGDRVYWLEGRPSEGGRQVVVRWAPGVDARDAIGEGWSARTTVHEYGGGAYAVSGETVFFSHFPDQRLYRAEPGQEPRPLTPEAREPMAYRYADGRVSPDGRELVCVRERHMDGAVVNDIVVVDAVNGGEPVELASGADFFSAPRFSADGRRLAWLCWRHPHMPWDGSELWTGEFADDGLAGAERIAGGPDESISQPRWSPDGVLHWVSDRTGWWNLYAYDGGGAKPLAPLDAEFTGPDWIFGQSTYGFLADGRIIVTWWHRALANLGVLDPSGRLDRWEVPFTAVSSLRPFRDGVVAVVASATDEPAVVVLDGDGEVSETLRRSRPVNIDPGYISAAQPIEFSTEDGKTAHALWYEPVNEDAEGPAGARPPLIVMSHGGPTASASPALNLATQYWTTRGFAVVDVNY